MAWSKGEKVVLAGSPVVQEKKVGSNATAAKMLPGALVIRDASDEKIKECGANATNVLGWLGYEQAHPDYKPASRTTAYAVGDFAPVIAGAGTVLIAKIASGNSITQGDLLVSAADGELAKAAAMDGSVDSGATTVTSTAANGDIITLSGSAPAGGVVVAIAEETVDASGGAKYCVVRSLI